MQQYTKEKILLLLLSGVALGFSRTPQRHWKILKNAYRVWKQINGEKLKEDIHSLYRSQFVGQKENVDGSITITLTKKGKLRALTYHFKTMKGNSKKQWDKKWRIVLFDIPDKLKVARDALRGKLRDFGFYEFQESAFVYPFECEDEIDFIIEFFSLRPYVRLGILERVDNELHLKKIFELL